MKSAALHPQEEERLATLEAYQILDTALEPLFDDLTLLASHIFKTPIALISLIDKDRQWFKSKVGLDASETHRDLAFCAHAILENDVFIVKNALEDERFWDNPLAVEAPNVIFYAGAPLIAPDGLPMGTLCVIDHKARLDVHPEHIEALQALSRQVVSQMELRLKLQELAQKNKALEAAIHSKSNFIQTVSHEFHQNISNVTDLSHLLENAQLNPEQQAFNELIKTTSQSLSSLSQAVIDHSAIETNAIRIENQLFSIQDSVTQILRHLKSEADSKSMQLNCTIDENVPEILHGDPKRLNQLLIYLGKESIRRHSGNILPITLCAQQNHITFEFKDDGKMLSPDTIQYIFDIYHTPAPLVLLQNPNFGDSELSRLNLSIAHKLAKMMGGALEITTSTKEFTLFTLKLPLISSEHSLA